MSIYPLLLPGWEDLSTWGIDTDYFYAQLTRNGHSDDNGPDFAITPPNYPTCGTAHQLAAAISRVTGAEPATVLHAMAAGVDPQTRQALGLPSEQPSPPARAYLDVPYGDKDAAKAAGARWDPDARRWYDPRATTPALQPWAARPDVPELLPGEDRTFGNGLFVDLVPHSCWFTNVRSCVTEQDWERLRRPIMRRAGHRCEACGAAEDRAAGHWLDAHERSHYDEQAGIQSLRRLIALCKPCHLVTHFGYANVTGRTDEAFAHLCAVTGMTQAQAWDHIRAAENLWIERSARVWELDLSMLTDAGVTLARPEAAVARATAAERELRGLRASAAVPAQGTMEHGAPAPPVEAPAKRPRWFSLDPPSQLTGEGES
jgi:hypothetical protein